MVDKMDEVIPQQQLPTPSGLPSDLDLGHFAKMMSNVYNTSALEAEDCKT